MRANIFLWSKMLQAQLKKPEFTCQYLQEKKELIEKDQHVLKEETH